MENDNVIPEFSLSTNEALHQIWTYMMGLEKRIMELEQQQVTMIEYNRIIARLNELEYITFPEAKRSGTITMSKLTKKQRRKKSIKLEGFFEWENDPSYVKLYLEHDGKGYWTQPIPKQFLRRAGAER